MNYHEHYSIPFPEGQSRSYTATWDGEGYTLGTPQGGRFGHVKTLAEARVAIYDRATFELCAVAEAAQRRADEARKTFETLDGDPFYLGRYLVLNGGNLAKALAGECEVQS